MARNTQQAEVTVTLNGQAAKRAVADLTQEYEKLQKEAVAAYKAGDDALGRKLDSQAQKLMKDIQITSRETKKFADVMKNINGATLKELNAAARQLKQEINKLTPGTKEFIEKSKQLQQVNTRIKTLNNEFKGLVKEQKQATLSLKSLSDGFNRYFGMVTTGIATITGLSMAFRGAAEAAAKLDDTYADVMKTTGLTHEQVEELDKALMEIDTRTSREQLLNLARDAGKLGIQGSENILGFVRAADQIQVALGEDLGEGAIKELGKIADVLGYTKSMGIEQSLLSIASAVNAVGQASTASEAYLVEFTQRLAGVGAQTGLSAADLIGFASGLDQSAMKVEMASTAFQKFVMKLYEDPAQFAKYAKMEVQEFSDLLANDANRAITTVLTALNQEDGFASLVPVFKEMGLDGARAVSVLAAMATNIQAVTDAQALANTEFSKATSVTEEYETKNNNLQAQLEKARKEFTNATVALGQSLNPIMLKSTKLTTYLIKALANYGKEIKTVLLVIAALTIALKAKVVWLKLVATWNATVKATSLALAAAQALLAGNITRATAAWKLMSTAMKASVFGLVVAGVSALVIWLQRLSKETKQLTELERFQAKLHEDVGNAVSEEASKVQALKAIVEDSNQSYDQRKKALEELKALVPEYHANLTEEGELINNNVDALNDYINTMLQAAKTQVMMDALTENAAKQQKENEYLLANAPKQFMDAMGNWRYSYNELLGERDDGTQGVLTHWISEDCAAAIKRLEEYKKEEEIILDSIAEAGKGKFDSITRGNGGGGGGGLDPKELKKIYDARMQELERGQRQEENALKESLVNREITQEEYNARMNLLNLQYLQKKAELARQFGQDETQYMSKLLDEQIKQMESALEETDTMLANAQSDIVDQKAYDAFQDKIYAKAASIRQQITEKSAKEQYDIEVKWAEALAQKKILTEEEAQQYILNTKIRYAQSAAQKVQSISEQASNFVNALQEYETQRLESEYQAQLTAAGDNAEQREKIEAEHEQKKLDLQKKYADIDMGINIAKTIANGAVAAIKAYAELGPVAGAIMAGIIAATTAAQVAAIVAQRNAIKNTSVSTGNTSSASSASASGTAESVQEPAGTRSVNGYSSGGYTDKAASDRKPVGVIHANEWVAPAWMVRMHPATFANLERYRRSAGGTTANARTGFANGGFTSSHQDQEPSTMQFDWQAMRAFADALVYATEHGIQAYMVYSQFEQFMQTHNKFKEQTSR